MTAEFKNFAKQEMVEETAEIPMNEKYIIIWTSKAKNSSGIGKRYMSKEEAEALSAELNQEHPEFLHHAVNTETEQPLARLRALREHSSDSSPNAVGLPAPAFAAAAGMEPDSWGSDVLPNIPPESFEAAFQETEQPA